MSRQVQHLRRDVARRSHPQGRRADYPHCQESPLRLHAHRSSHDNSVEYKNTQVNFIDSKENIQNTKLNEHQNMLPAKIPAMPATPFDNLLLRKFNRLKTRKSAISILILTHWFILELKKLVRMNKVEKDETETELLLLDSILQEKSHLPKCLREDEYSRRPKTPAPHVRCQGQPDRQRVLRVHS